MTFAIYVANWSVSCSGTGNGTRNVSKTNCFMIYCKQKVNWHKITAANHKEQNSEKTIKSYERNKDKGPAMVHQGHNFDLYRVLWFSVVTLCDIRKQRVHQFARYFSKHLLVSWMHLPIMKLSTIALKSMTPEPISLKNRWWLNTALNHEQINEYETQIETTYDWVRWSLGKKYI